MQQMVDTHTKTRKFHIDFFQLVCESGESISHLFDQLLVSDSRLHCEHYGITRELWNPEKRVSPSSITGMLRKFRTSDLPEIGALGEAPETLPLKDGQGIIEYNHFVYFEEFQILAWVVNGHGSTPNQFAMCLSDLFKKSIVIAPLLKPDAMKRLMKGDVDLKKFSVRIAKPTNPDMFPSDDFSSELLKMMGSSEADSIFVELSTDTRNNNAKGKALRLCKDLKKTIVNLASHDPKTLKSTLIEDGMERPIDFIKDKLRSTQSIETNAKYAPSATMYQMIDTAKDESKSDIDAIFS